MNDAEVGTLMKTFVDNVKTYEQVVEVRATFFLCLASRCLGFLIVCIHTASGLHVTACRRIDTACVRIVPSARASSSFYGRVIRPAPSLSSASAVNCFSSHWLMSSSSVCR